MDERQHRIQRLMKEHDLRERGVKAWHPRQVDLTPVLQQPNFFFWNDGLTVGDPLAIGNVGEELRIVHVKRLFTRGTNLTKWLEFE